MANLFEKQMAIQRAVAIKYLLPQTCQFKPATGANPVISGMGVLSFDAPVAREYNGSPDIPCRVDLSRAFRPGSLPSQVTSVDEHILEVPFDFSFEETDIVYIGANRYIVRKTNAEGVWNVTQEAVISQLGVELNVV